MSVSCEGDWVLWQGHLQQTFELEVHSKQQRLRDQVASDCLRSAVAMTGAAEVTQVVMFAVELKCGITVEAAR